MLICQLGVEFLSKIQVVDSHLIHLMEGPAIKLNMSKMRALQVRMDSELRGQMEKKSLRPCTLAR